MTQIKNKLFGNTYFDVLKMYISSNFDLQKFAVANCKLLTNIKGPTCMVYKFKKRFMSLHFDPSRVFLKSKT